MTDVPPEIEKLRKRVIGPLEVGAAVLLSDAEAAVLACEQRMRQQVHFLPAAPLDAETTELAFIEGIAFVNAAKHEQTVDLMRVRTVREIVEALRGETERLNMSNDVARVAGCCWAADLIEQRFGGEKGEQT